MSETIFEIKNLKFSYPQSHEILFQNFSLSLQKNEILAIVGRSGCGKSTLLKLIFGILKPQNGQVCHTAKHAVYISQEEALIPWKTVLNNMLLPFKLYGQQITPEVTQRANKLLADAGLDSHTDKLARELSGGMRKRLELARSLLQNPDFLLMDEPFSSLDVFTREQMVLLCKKLQQEHQFAMVFVTHHAEEAVFLGDKVIVLGNHPVQIVYQENLPDKSSENLFSLQTQEENTTKTIHHVLSSSCDTYCQSDIPAHIKGKSWLQNFAGTMVALVAILIIMAIISLGKTLFNWPDYLVPYPKDIFLLFFNTLWDNSLVTDILSTISVSMGGFILAFIITIPLGYLIACSKTAAQVLLPPVIVFNTLPIIALTPFFLLWFGLTMMTKVLITLLIIFFPLLIITRQAFILARQQTFIHRSNFVGTPVRTFIYLEWPYALPTLFSGWRTALSGSIIGAVVSEFLFGSVGLGALINLAKARFDTPLMFVALIWLAILGLNYFLLIHWIQKPFMVHTN